MPLQATSGAASYDAFGGGVAAVPNYIEECFSTTLYTGTGATLTIANGIDLSTKGGMSWSKRRDAAGDHFIQDTVRGASYYLQSNTTNAQGGTSDVTFLTNGYSMGAGADMNISGRTNVNWTFREQPKFFDVVTYTGDGTNNRAISHNLGSTPGFIIVKTVSTAQSWICYHTALGTGNYLSLNSTSASAADANAFPAVSSTTFTPTADDSLFSLNTSGVTFVAYVFAHNAGGFGLTGTDNVISCGSFTTDGSGVATVDLGYEPQYLMWKASSQDGNWLVLDNMRGWTNGGNDSLLRPNTSDAESTGGQYGHPTATGFYMQNMAASATYIYIAIRRGPMKVPTSGTSVFAPVAAAGGTGTKLTTNFPVDLQIWSLRGDGGSSKRAVDRLRGVSSNTTTSGVALFTDLTSAEDPASASTRYFDNTGFTIPDNFLGSGLSAIYWNWRRAPGFMDVVCYTGTGGATTVAHNLGVAPQLIIVKARDNTTFWSVYDPSNPATNYLRLNADYQTNAAASAWNDTVPTSSVFSVGSANNSATINFVAYLFATCAGVSKVFSFTGNGTTQTINCGFTGGARFVLLKASSATGGWYVYDTARGMTVLTDPYLQLNSTAAETATLGSVTTVTTGFAVNEAITTGVNTNGVTYIGLAIA